MSEMIMKWKKIFSPIPKIEMKENTIDWMKQKFLREKKECDKERAKYGINNW